MNTLLGGDFRFLWPENIHYLAQLPYAWDNILNNGLGGFNLSLWINTYLSFTTTFSYLGLSWIAITIIFWLLPTFLGSFFFMKFFFAYLFPKIAKYSFIAGAIYSINTYILLVVLGGQMGVGLAYSLVPLVLLSFIKTFNRPTLRASLLTGLVLALQLLLDVRFVYMTLIVVFAYWIFISRSIQLRFLLYSFVIPAVCTILLNSFWILPTLFHGGSAVSSNLASSNSFSFFSFADFPHALGFLHPNWPENIFGKVYFMNWQFLLLPVVAFSGLLFIDTKQFKKTEIKKETLLFFSVLLLLGVFLAKGSNPPFEQVNQFIYSSIPGMRMFRDSTKWYTVIAIGYSILIPFSLYFIYQFLLEKLPKKKSLLISSFYFVVVGAFFVYLISPVFVYQYRSMTFHKIPDGYVQLEKFLYSQKNFSRTLWIPQVQRYAFFSPVHPAVSPNELLHVTSTSKVLTMLPQKKTEHLIEDAGVEYIIVPFDSEKELFLRDRKYDEKSYKKVISTLNSDKWLKRVNDFGGNVVYQVPHPKDHFWSTSKNTTVSYIYINPTHYIVTLKNAKKNGQLIFSESFDNGWTATITNSTFQSISKTYDEQFNSFVLPKDGDYTMDIFYEPQKWVESGEVISFVSFVVIGACLLGLKKRKII
ncbi:MAG TPA: hypothetical protein VLF93_06765 [Candidatus Saccharimonadales bacterium]|nr:hypothetical protein [Candidatus Saccharimonadales bacterium]